ncbi:hypothetical protein FIB18_12860 [Brucella pecoris]|uniref:Uncharacterized protein n=1 Tax=Brucella pecoris TaxID=867683 RepID=A0A5C5CKA9_9HYPH|nr:hypothetical protein FIB18_12860 [Brucella pecoris]
MKFLPLARARFDLIQSDRCSNHFFDAHLIPKSFHIFRDTLYIFSPGNWLACLIQSASWASSTSSCSWMWT